MKQCKLKTDEKADTTYLLRTHSTHFMDKTHTYVVVFTYVVKFLLPAMRIKDMFHAISQFIRLNKHKFITSPMKRMSTFQLKY